MSTLHDQLLHFGLAEKESQVYIAALELGPSPVQVIARKAAVNRATTYVQIASLTVRGLMSSYEQGKKRFFVAEAPDRLAMLYEDELQHLKQKEAVLKDILPALKNLRPQGNLPRVRLYEGHEGAAVLRQEFLESKDKEFSNFFGFEHYDASIPARHRDDAFVKEKAKNAGMKGRIIISGKEFKGMRPGSMFPHLERHSVTGDEFDAPGEIAIYDKRVVFMTFKGDPVGVVIESPEISKTLQALFNLAWSKVKHDKKV